MVLLCGSPIHISVLCTDRDLLYDDLEESGNVMAEEFAILLELLLASKRPIVHHPALQQLSPSQSYY